VFGRGGTERMAAYPLILWVIGFGGYMMSSKKKENRIQQHKISQAELAGDTEVKLKLALNCIHQIFITYQCYAY
jgi:hypothetical protein